MTRTTFVTPKLTSPVRAIMLGAVTSAWYVATTEERESVILPRFRGVIEEWSELGAKSVGTLDDDLFMVGQPGAPDFTWYLIYDVPAIETVPAMIQRVREDVGGVRLDRYIRIEARVGRPFFLIEDNG
jgi:hypothetical protein